MVKTHFKALKHTQRMREREIYRERGGYIYQIYMYRSGFLFNPSTLNNGGGEALK